MSGPSQAPSGVVNQQLSFGVAKQNLLQSIGQYRGLKNTFVPNDNARDAALKTAIQNASTWTQLGVLGSQLSPRFALLTKPIKPLGSDYTSSISPRFDEGTVGWYWLYGTDLAVQSAYLICIFRFPTAKHSAATDTFYSVFGYVVKNGVTTPFSTLGVPIMCPGAFNASAVPDALSLVMDLSMHANNADVSLLSLSLTGTSSKLTDMSVQFAMKNTPGVYAATSTSAIPASFEGKNGCLPCVDGAGTNYWSFTYLTGAATKGFATTPPATIGWFDHQWVNPAPKDSVVRAFMTFSETLHASEPSSWIFLTLQPSADVQYVLTTMFTRKQLAGLAMGKPYKVTTCNIFPAGSPPRYNQKATIVIKDFAAGTQLPNHLLVIIQAGTSEEVSMTIQAACDGRVTLPNGGINLEAVSKVMDVTGKVQLGVGCIEVNNFSDFTTTTTRMMALAGLHAPVTVFMPSRVSLSQGAASIGLVAAIVLAPVIFLVLVIVLGVVLVKKTKLKK